MKRFLAALGLAAVITSSAFAQGGSLQDEFDRGQFSFRLGAFFPTESALRDPADLWLAVGADFDMAWGLFRNTYTVVSIDWYTYNGFRSDNVVPVIISQRWYTSNAEERRMYFFAGLGAAFMDFGGGQTRFAARGGIGLDFTERYFIEGHFTWIEDPNDIASPTGFAIFGGIRL